MKDEKDKMVSEQCKMIMENSMYGYGLLNNNNLYTKHYKEIYDTELNDLLGGGIIAPGVNLFILDDNDIDSYTFVYSFIYNLCKDIQSGHDIYTIFMDKFQPTGSTGIYISKKSRLFKNIADISHEYKRASFIITNKSTFCTTASYISSAVFDVKKVDNGYKFILWKPRESEADLFNETKYCILSKNDENKIICVESH